MEKRECPCESGAAGAGRFCPHCGRELMREAAPTSPGSQPVGQGLATPPSAALPGGQAGGAQEQPEQGCPACRAVLDRAWKYCPACGVRAALSARWRLILHAPDGTCQEVPLDASAVILGSGPEAPVQLRDPYVSKKHCRFSLAADGGCQVEDLGSSNGTFVKVKGPTAVAPGTELLVGGTLISVEKD